MQFYSDNPPHDELSDEYLRTLPVPELERVLAAQARDDRRRVSDLDARLHRLGQRALSTSDEADIVDVMIIDAKVLVVDTRPAERKAVAAELLETLLWVDLHVDVGAAA